LLTVDQVADRLQVSKWSVYRRVAAGEIPAVKLGAALHSPIRIPEPALDAWLYDEPKEN
jgi:excisionase family DNA binding protein